MSETNGTNGLKDPQILAALNGALEQLLEAQKRTVIEQSDRLERERLELYQRIFDYSNDAIIVSDPGIDRILDANPSAEALLGYPRDEMIGSRISAIHPFDFGELGQFADSVIANGSGWTDELICVGRDGREIPAEISASAIYISGRPCLLAMVRDIRERKSAEDTARQMAIQDERHRLATELHDSVTQSLYSLILFAESGRRAAAAGESSGAEVQLENVARSAQQALKEMRLLVNQLRPSEFEHGGLAGAIQRRLEAVERRAGVQAYLTTEGSADMDPEIEYEVFTVIQEALNNSLKHARARTVNVAIEYFDDRLDFSVTDNGLGFEPGDSESRGGMGLSNIADRISRVLGTVEISSRPGTGTTVNGSVPYGIQSRGTELARNHSYTPSDR
jgi:PAS domain S-box-containing protein